MDLFAIKVMEDSGAFSTDSSLQLFYIFVKVFPDTTHYYLNSAEARSIYRSGQCLAVGNPATDKL